MATYKKSYADLSFDFTANPQTGDVATVKDAVSVKRGIKNVLLTAPFERLYQPEFGSGIKTILFEPMTPLTALNLQRKVEEVLNNFEPRAKITQILADPDIDRNAYRLEIKFYVIGIQNPITVETFLERLR